MTQSLKSSLGRQLLSAGNAALPADHLKLYLNGDLIAAGTCTGNGLPAVPMYRESFGDGADIEPLLQMENLPDGQVRLSWLTFGATYTLKSTASLAPPAWQPVPGTPTQLNGRWTMTLNAGLEARFFRLERN